MHNPMVTRNVELQSKNESTARKMQQHSASASGTRLRPEQLIYAGNAARSAATPRKKRRTPSLLALLQPHLAQDAAPPDAGDVDKGEDSSGGSYFESLPCGVRHGLRSLRGIILALVYIPFVYAIVLQAVRGGGAVDPAEWVEKLDSINLKTAMIAAPLLIFGISTIVSLVFVPTGHFGELYGLAALLLAYQACIYRYIVLRPELCQISRFKEGAKFPLCGRRCSRQSRGCRCRARCNPCHATNWFMIMSLVLEVITFLTIAFSVLDRAELESIMGGSATNSSIASGGAGSTLQHNPVSSSNESLALIDGDATFGDNFATALIKPMQESYAVIQLWTGVVATLIYAFFTGLFIEYEVCPSSTVAPLVFEFWSGSIFVTIFTCLFNSLASAHTRGSSGDAFLTCSCLFIYSSTAIYISVYRGDQTGKMGDLIFIPKFLYLERVLKMILSIATVLTCSYANGAVLLSILLATEICYIVVVIRMAPCNVWAFDRSRIILTTMAAAATTVFLVGRLAGSDTFDLRAQLQVVAATVCVGFFLLFCAAGLAAVKKNLQGHATSALPS